MSTVFLTQYNIMPEGYTRASPESVYPEIFKNVFKNKEDGLFHLIELVNSRFQMFRIDFMNSIIDDIKNKNHWYHPLYGTISIEEIKYIKD